jgi:hypothetical protein
MRILSFLRLNLLSMYTQKNIYEDKKYGLYSNSTIYQVFLLRAALFA